MKKILQQQFTLDIKVCLSGHLSPIPELQEYITFMNGL